MRGQQTNTQKEMEVEAGQSMWSSMKREKTAEGEGRSTKLEKCRLGVSLPLRYIYI